MKTEIFKIDPTNIDVEVMSYCGKIIREGGLVCFPTETVYGLGANSFDASAVKKIFEAKGRPQDNPLIVHIADIDMLHLITPCEGEAYDRIMKLAAHFWPGPLTMVSPKDDAIPDTVTCGLSTVGIRYPSNEIAKALIKCSGVPIAAPSANLSGKPSPTTGERCIEDLSGRVDVIIDGGACSVGVESTVFDVTKELTVLRPGAVTREQIAEVLGKASEIDWTLPVEGKPRSPGMKYRHYAPKATMYLFEGSMKKVSEKIRSLCEEAKAEGKKVGILVTDQTVRFYGRRNPCADTILSIGDRKDPFAQARNVFDTLRDFDDEKVDVIFAEAVPREGVGNAVMNRLFRAAGGKIEKL